METSDSGTSYIKCEVIEGVEIKQEITDDEFINFESVFVPGNVKIEPLEYDDVSNNCDPFSIENSEHTTSPKSCTNIKCETGIDVDDIKTEINENSNDSDVGEDPTLFIDLKDELLNDLDTTDLIVDIVECPLHKKIKIKGESNPSSLCKCNSNIEYLESQIIVDPKFTPDSKYSQELKFVCPICSRYFDTKKRLIKHIINIHENDDIRSVIKKIRCKIVTVFNCKLCKYRRFYRQTGLDEHLKTFHQMGRKNVSEKPSVTLADCIEELMSMRCCCSLCDADYSRPTDVRRHIVSKHNNISNANIVTKPITHWKCKYCYKRFNSRESAVFHATMCTSYKLISTNIPNGNCSTKKEDQNVQLKKHFVQELRYDCPGCFSTFKLFGDLKKHIRLKHDNEIKNVKNSCVSMYKCMRCYTYHHNMKAFESHYQTCQVRRCQRTLLS